VPYWCVARSEPGREAVAVRFLDRRATSLICSGLANGASTKAAALAIMPPLFSNYLFVRIESGWWEARRCIGVAAIVMAGDEPGKLADSVIDRIRSREQNGLIVLPERSGLPGDPIRVTGGLLMGATGLVSCMRSSERVAVLLATVGTVVLPASTIEARSGQSRGYDLRRPRRRGPRPGLIRAGRF
jgi:transcription antitermination factor NusG